MSSLTFSPLGKQKKETREMPCSASCLLIRSSTQLIQCPIEAFFATEILSCDNVSVWVSSFSLVTLCLAIESIDLTIDSRK